MKHITPSGEELDFGDAWAKSATKYARSKGLNDIWVARGTTEYVIFRTNEATGEMDPIYASQSFEQLGVHIDILAMDAEFAKREKGEQDVGKGSEQTDG